MRDGYVLLAVLFLGLMSFIGLIEEFITNRGK